MSIPVSLTLLNTAAYSVAFSGFWDGTDYQVDTLKVTLNNAGGTAIQGSFPAVMRVPRACVDGNPPAAAGAVMALAPTAANPAGWVELCRQFQQVEITWAAFCDVPAAAGMIGDVRITLPSDAGAASIDARLRVLSPAGAAPQSAFSFSVLLPGSAVVGAAPVPGLAIDLEDAGILLPRLSFPTLSFAGAPVLPLVNLANAAAPFLQRFADALPVPVTVAITTNPANATAKVQLGLAAGKPSFSLVDGTGAILGLNLEIAWNGTRVATVEIPKLVYNGIALNMGAVAFAPAAMAPQPLAHSVPFGPLVISWDAALTVVAVPASAPAMLAAQLDIASLRISASEDPSVVLELRGVLQATASHAWFQSLSLVQPDPLDLITQALAQTARLESGMIRLAASAAPAAAQALDKTLNALARLANAVGRAATLAANATGSALAGIANLVSDALTDLRALAPAGIPIAVELRLGTAPFVLRQIRVTTEANGETVLGGSALQLTIKAGWQAGVLIDFHAAPGFYLVACAPAPGAGAPAVAMATLSTDLWLTDTGTDGAGQPAEQNQPVQGSDAAGAPAADPLLSLDAGLRNTIPGDATLVVLAGLSRGRPVFLRRATAKLQSAPLSGRPGIVVLGDGFALTDLTHNDLVLNPRLNLGPAGRVLSLLGSDATQMAGEVQNALGQVVTVTNVALGNGNVDGRSLSLTLNLTLTIAGASFALPLDLTLSLETLAATLSTGSTIVVKGSKIDTQGLGLDWLIVPATDQSLFTINFDPGNSKLALADGAVMTLTFRDASPGGGIVFTVTNFSVSAAGVQLDANVNDQTVALNGLDVPFRFTDGGLSIAHSKVTRASISGQGTLPRELIGDATASVALVLQTREDGRLHLASASASLDRAGQPIVCEATRFTVTLDHVGFEFIEDNGTHFYFTLTGSARFTPLPGEFSDGLLKYFSGLTIQLDKVPLASDARVLAQHISFQVAMSPVAQFNLFDVFAFEVRGIGFHPSLPAFDGKRAIRISGQVAFTAASDVINPRIDFHGLMIGPPEPGQYLPRVRCDELGVDVELAGGVRIAAAVAAVDGNLPTLDARTSIPSKLKANGFLGSGRLTIPGFASLSAAVGFMQIAPPAGAGQRERAFFLYVEQDDVAYDISTPIWPMFIRQIGAGFGAGFTLIGIARADEASTPAQQIQVLAEISKVQGNLSDFNVWAIDYTANGPPRWTLAARIAVSMTTTSTEQDYDPDGEPKLPNPLFFDLVAAMRSDLTFLAAVRAWPNVNYADFRENDPAITEHPMLRGYLYISAPRHEFLAQMLADPTGYIGAHPPMAELTATMLRSVTWSALLYITPSLFQAELGWPDQLVAQLANEPNFRAQVRGGLVLRITDGLVLQGINVVASAYFHFGGSLDLGCVGVNADATLNAGFTARMITCIDMQRPLDSLYYSMFELHASLDVSISAWMHIPLLFTSININLSFNFELQISAAVELAVTGHGLGAHANARIGVRVFGHTLTVPISLTAGSSGILDTARAQVARYLSISLTADTPAPGRGQISSDADANLLTDAQSAQQSAGPDRPSQPAPQAQPAQSPAPPPPIQNSKFGVVLGNAAFNLVLLRAQALPTGVDGDPGDYFYAFILPSDILADATANPGFYAPPPGAATVLANSGSAVSGAPAADYQLTLPVLSPAAKRFDAITNRWIAVPGGATDIYTHWMAPADANGHTFVDLIAHCYLYDAEWQATGYKPVPCDSTGTGDFWRDPQPAALNPVAAPDAATRGTAQRAAQAALTYDCPERAAARQARSLVLTQFMTDLEEIAAGGAAGATLAAQTGLLFLLQAADVAGISARIMRRSDGAGGYSGCPLKVFNPPELMFEKGVAALADMHCEIGQQQGVHLGWRLDVNGLPELAAEHLLHHYEITRRIPGLAEGGVRVSQVKPAWLYGRLNPATQVQDLLPPAWQFTDDLSDLPADQRAALLCGGMPEDIKAMAVAWEKLSGEAFATRTPCLIAYTVIPVDCAGTSGDPHSLVCNIPPPLLPPRAANAVLLLEVNGLPAPAAGTGLPPRLNNLRVTIGVNDPHWKNPNPGEYRVYELICEPERIVPSGFYGSDGQTDRLQTPPSGSAPTAAATVLQFTREDLQNYALDPKGFSPPDDFGDNAIWAWLAGEARESDPPPPLPLLNAAAAGPAEQLLNALWRWPPPKDGPPPPNGGRVAVRCSLRTITRYEVTAGLKATADLASAPVPVALELRMVAPPPGGANPAGVKTDPLTLTALRPASFEWPVREDLAPLVPGEVKAIAGLAQIFAPLPGKTLRDFCENPHNALDPLDDPAHRSMTMISFTAAPSKLLDDSAATLAGFDVLEMAVDGVTAELAASLHLEDDLAAWDRARRLTRVQLIRPEEAMLQPGSIVDLARWQARYPSTSWRNPNSAFWRGQPAHPPGPPPVPPAGWYSPAETLPAWPSPRLRDRLLLWPDEAAITAIFAQGPPISVTLALTVPPNLAADSQPAAIGFTLANVLVTDGTDGTVRAVNFAGSMTDHGGITSISPPAGQLLRPADLRIALTMLAWTAPQPWHAKYAQDPASFNGLSLSITPQLQILNGQTAHANPVQVALDFTPGLHPALEETLALLTMQQVIGSDGYTADIYRRYSVQADAAPPVNSANLQNFLSATSPAQDPFGWGILALLGLACAFKLHDQECSAFIPPGTLLPWLQAVFDEVVARYARPGDPELGIPFAEILARPGADRVAQPFNRLLSFPDTGIVTLDGRLALMQISLRPSRLPVAGYRRYTLSANAIYGLNGPDPFNLPAPSGGTLSAIRIEVTLGAAATDTLWSSDADMGATPAPLADTKKTSVTLAVPAGGVFHPVDLSLLVRAVPADAEPDFSYQLSRYYRLTDGTSAWVGPSAIAPSPETKAIHTPGQFGPIFDPFGHFAALDAGLLTSAISPSAGVAPGWKNLQSWISRRFKTWSLPDDPNAIQQLLPTYCLWAARFLDHSAAPVPAIIPPAVQFAVAAHETPFPWHVAADAAGMISLSFLHEDRWGGTRAYAVRPLSRWMPLAAAQLKDWPLPLSALPSPAPSVGYAVADTRRTQAVAKPGLQAPRGQRQPASALDVVITRPDELDRMASNRGVAAKLDMRGVARVYFRVYAYSDWPRQFCEALTSPATPPDPYPEISPLNLPERPASETDPPFGTEDFALLVTRFPAVLSGAQLYRHAPELLPYFYDLGLAAVALAGIMVSEPAIMLLGRGASSLTDNFTRATTAWLPVLDVVPGPAGGAALQVTVPLLSYRDCMTRACAAIWAAEAGSVADCPDPDIIYSVVLRQPAVPGLPETLEPQAELRLVVQAKAVPAPLPVPLALRCLGNWFAPYGQPKLAGSLGAATATLQLALKAELAAPPPSPPPLEWVKLPGSLSTALALLPPWPPGSAQPPWVSGVDIVTLKLDPPPDGTAAYLTSITNAVAALAALPWADLLKHPIALLEDWLVKANANPAALPPPPPLSGVFWRAGSTIPAGMAIASRESHYLLVHKAPLPDALAGLRAAVTADCDAATAELLRLAALRRLLGGSTEIQVSALLGNDGPVTAKPALPTGYR